MRCRRCTGTHTPPPAATPSMPGRSKHSANRWRRTGSSTRPSLIVSLDGDFLDPGPQQVGASRAWIDARRRLVARGRVAGDARGRTVADTDLRQGRSSSAGRAARPAAAGTSLLLDRQAKGGRGADRGNGADTVVAALEARPGPEHRARPGRISRPSFMQSCIGSTRPSGIPARRSSIPTRWWRRRNRFDDLVEAMRHGEVAMLVMLDTNPVYTAPADADFGQLLSSVALKVHAGLHVDETAALSDWHLPLSHPLECLGRCPCAGWHGDADPADHSAAV